MYLVKAARWHSVEWLPAADGAPSRRCSVCGGADLIPSGETALDASVNRRYGVLRCRGCGYDLLEPQVRAAAAS